MEPNVNNNKLTFKRGFGPSTFTSSSRKNKKKQSRSRSSSSSAESHRGGDYPHKEPEFKDEGFNKARLGPRGDYGGPTERGRGRGGFVSLLMDVHSYSFWKVKDLIKNRIIKRIRQSTTTTNLKKKTFGIEKYAMIAVYFLLWLCTWKDFSGNQTNG